jgi:hypothetical protein
MGEPAGLAAGSLIDDVYWRLLGADFEHFGAADGADALGGGAAILHRDGLGILHFSLGAAFNTISLHSNPPLKTYF